MDNLSHSLVGLALGEILHRRLCAAPDLDHQRARRKLLLVSGWLASNFPDLDIVLTPLLPAPLGYLLHHRGHTHTLLYALPQALLVAALVWLCWPAARRLLKQSNAARAGFLLALAGGFTLHLLMDYLNSYGIHPFHPFNSRWIYGDMVFILEPVFWIAFGVPLTMMVARRSLRLLLLGLFIAIPVFLAYREFLSWLSVACLATIGLAVAVVQHRAGPRGVAALALAASVCLGFVGTQGITSAMARRKVVQDLHRKDPDSVMRDAAMTAFPSNPVCWSFVSVEVNEAQGLYRLRRGLVSAAPDLFPVAACPGSLYKAAGRASTPAAIAYLDETQGALATLRALKDTNCYFEAWLRFARAPAVTGSQAADLRFAASPRGNFTTLDLEAFKHRACPQYVPHWDFPRADLLGQPSR